MRGSRTEPSDVTRLFFLCVCGGFFFGLQNYSKIYGQISTEI